VRQLKAVAQARGQSLAQLAVAWVLRHQVVASALIGASRVSQIEEIVATLNNLDFTAEELRAIEKILAA
ncbi:MAG: aldo/keto reductase, partial [Chloroflexi bacterium]|nr:aldo/keto reductase [Chloroflexota bacterium]